MIMQMSNSKVQPSWFLSLKWSWLIIALKVFSLPPFDFEINQTKLIEYCPWQIVYAYFTLDPPSLSIAK